MQMSPIHSIIQSFTYLFIYSFNKHLLYAHCVPGNVLGAWDTTLNKIKKSSACYFSNKIKKEFYINKIGK